MESMTILDMSFHYVDITNANALENYLQNTTKEEMNKKPFYYPYFM